MACDNSRRLCVQQHAPSARILPLVRPTSHLRVLRDELPPLRQCRVTVHLSRACMYGICGCASLSILASLFCPENNPSLGTPCPRQAWSQTGRCVSHTSRVWGHGSLQLGRSRSRAICWVRLRSGRSRVDCSVSGSWLSGLATGLPGPFGRRHCIDLVALRAGLFAPFANRSVARR